MRSFNTLFFVLFMLTTAPAICNAQQLTNTSFTLTTSDNIKLPVKVSGKGSPCMFVPGGPGDAYISFEQLGGNNLEKYLTMVYMDQRGAGSAQNASDYSMDRMLKDMDEVRAKLHIDKMYLLSHSFGGILLVNYAKKYPQHVLGLILVNSTLYFLSPAGLAEQFKYGYKLLGKDTSITSTNVDTLFDANGKLRQKMRKAHVAYKLLTDSIKTIVLLDKLDSLHPRTTDFGYKVMGPVIDKSQKMMYPEYYKDYTPLTTQINAPVLVINGTHDHAIGPDHYKLFKFPHQKVVQIDGGHLLYYEENKKFVEAVRQFVVTKN